MAIKPSDYPKNWKQIRAEILNRSRNARGQEQCECCGECLKHRGRCDEIRHTRAKHFKGKHGNAKVILTTSHLCHSPKCRQRGHLRAMCQPCHQIYQLRSRDQRHLRGGDAVRWAMQQGGKASVKTAKTAAKIVPAHVPDARRSEISRAAAFKAWDTMRADPNSKHYVKPVK